MIAALRANGREATMCLVMADRRQAELGESPRSRVLVVDDEDLMARAITRLLRDTYEVVAVNSGKDALGRLKAGERFDAVLCDLSMPGMTGMELYEELRTGAPSVLPRFAFLTGGAMTQAAVEFLEAAPNPRLTKPFEAKELRQVVAEIIAAGRLRG